MRLPQTEHTMCDALNIILQFLQWFSCVSLLVDHVLCHRHSFAL